MTAAEAALVLRRPFVEAAVCGIHFAQVTAERNDFIEDSAALVLSPLFRLLFLPTGMPCPPSLPPSRTLALALALALSLSLSLAGWLAGGRAGWLPACLSPSPSTRKVFLSLRILSLLFLAVCGALPWHPGKAAWKLVQNHDEVESRQHASSAVPSFFLSSFRFARSFQARYCCRAVGGEVPSIRSFKCSCTCSWGILSTSEDQEAGSFAARAPTRSRLADPKVSHQQPIFFRFGLSWHMVMMLLVMMLG